MSPSSAILDDLKARGLIHDSTDLALMAAHLDEGMATLYCGFDPTADSLHLGNLIPLLVLRRFQSFGHRPLVLAGGATGMIGDPGGRSDERTLLDLDVLHANTAAVSRQLERFLDMSADLVNGAELVNNWDWTSQMTAIGFLRDVGKYLTVNSMMARDSVRSRLERESGISFTEFSYMLLQANDFAELRRTHDCTLQVAGSDQWGNITAGIELIRKRDGVQVHGLTAPLVLRADGTKFGKSSGQNLWLDAAKTSPYQMYQYLLGVDDGDVERFLLQMTLLDVDRCLDIATAHSAEPHLRRGQRELARQVVGLVHGTDALGPIEEASEVIFAAGIRSAGPEAWELLAGELPTTRLSRGEWSDDVDLLGLLASTGVAPSKGEVRRNLAGYRANGVQLSERSTAGFADLLAGRYLLLQRGKANHHVVVVE